MDYLAIDPDHRNSGAGTRLLQLLADHLAGDGSVLIEVEDPAYAINEDDMSLRNRRLYFYLRNGCKDTMTRVKCFGVEFILLSL